MSVDDTKIAYSSTWDIDQLISSGDVSIGVGTTTVAVLPGATILNEFSIDFKPSSGSLWYQPGKSSTNGTLGAVFDCYSYISGISLMMYTSTPGTARYYVWADKITY
jgi:hypothetical protein